MGQNEIQQMIEQVSGQKFSDTERQKQYEKLLTGLNLIVEKYTFDQIWENVGLLEKFRQKLEAIMVLIKVEEQEKNRVWTKEECVEWVDKAGFDEPEKVVNRRFYFEPDHIKIFGGLNLFDSRVEELPGGVIEITGFLDIQFNTKIHLSERLEITGDVFAKGCDPKLIAQLIRMKESGRVGGEVVVI